MGAKIELPDGSNALCLANVASADQAML